MALVKSILVDELRKIFDKEYSQFEGFPDNSQESGTRWAAAIAAYAGDVLPVVTSASVDLAEQAMFAVISTISAQAGNGIAQMPVSFTNFALPLAGGMAPAFVGVPPATVVNFASVYAIGNAGGSGQACANAMADIIDIWFKTGTATPSGGGTPINWS